MKSPIQKLLALALAALMLFPLVACGTPTEESVTTAASTEAASEAVTEDQNYVCDLPDDLNYNDEEINIMYVKVAGRDDELISEELGHGTISDAVYERNLAVETQLGVKLCFTDQTTDSLAQSAILKAVNGGDHTLDIFVIGTYCAVTPAISGCYLNLNALENVDTSKHYWSQDYNEMMTFTSENKQFLATSPAALSLFRLAYLTIYNRDLFAERSLPDLYEVVKEGKWTLEYQNSIVADEYLDADGDGRVSEGDFFGFITGDTISVDAYTVASGIRFISRDENGDWVGTEGINDAVIDMSEKVSALSNVQGTFVYEGTDHDDIGKYSIIEKFAEEEGLMATTQFLSIEKRINSLADIGYGIVPMPKLTEGQSNYYTYVQDQISGFGISAAVGDEKKQEMLGAVMEAIAYHSYTIVRPAYYDSTLSLRFMQDPQSGEILDMMFETVSFDRACTCFSVSIIGTMRDKLPRANPAMSSQMKVISKSIERALVTERKALDKLDKS